MSCSSVFTPIELFTAEDMGRRRHWSDEDKIRIVEESLRGHRQGSATARRYGISRSLLSIWRRAYREGTLGGEDRGGGFVPLVMEEAAPNRLERSAYASEDARIDIALANGRRMTIPASLPPSRLAALLAVVDPR
ncbi:IS66-like element accessory protein TnpA [Marivita sp.]|uniref:IS66-like element accessory protein TnpA n=1 Tax=Marivita sp. TaxID=2003365 RepID=UPI003F712BC1